MRYLLIVFLLILTGCEPADYKTMRVLQKQVDQFKIGDSVCIINTNTQVIISNTTPPEFNPIRGSYRRGTVQVIFPNNGTVVWLWADGLEFCKSEVAKELIHQGIV